MPPRDIASVRELDGIKDETKFPVEERRGALETGLWFGRNDSLNTSSPQKVMTKLDKIARNSYFMVMEFDCIGEQLLMKNY